MYFMSSKHHGSGTLVLSTTVSPVPHRPAHGRCLVSVLGGQVTLSACESLQQYRVLVRCQTHAKSFIMSSTFALHVGTHEWTISLRLYPDSLLFSCVTKGKSLNLSVPLFLQV